MKTAFRRTIQGGHWDRIVDRLTERAPHHLRGYDPNRFRCYWNTYKKRRGPRRVRGTVEPAVRRETSRRTAFPWYPAPCLRKQSLKLNRLLSGFIAFRS